MARTSRLEQYRRKRYRTAVRRRGIRRGYRPAACPEPKSLLRLLSREMADGEVCMTEALRGLAERLYVYPGVDGMVFDRDGDTVAITVIARRPMTAPMRLLALAWQRELETSCPGFRWKLGVEAEVTDGAEAAHCVFWRNT